MRKWERDVIEAIRAEGATDVSIVSGGKHPKITGLYRGQRFSRAMPGTPGDGARSLRHTVSNTVRAMRRAAGEDTARK